MKIHISRSVVPNLFTVLNIFFGFLCIVAAVGQQFEMAIWYIILGALCDSLDGFMARLTRSSSDFGVELDSLADVVSFGAAPSVFAYMLFLHEYGPIGTLLAAVQLIFGALRLARFNVQLVGFSKDHFTGLPIPLSALTILSFTFFFGASAIQADPVLQGWYIALIVGNGLLMVSTFQYPVFPKLTKQAFREKPLMMLAYIVGAVLVLVSLGRWLLFVLLALELSGIVYGSAKVLTRRSGRISSRSRPSSIRQR